MSVDIISFLKSLLQNSKFFSSLIKQFKRSKVDVSWTFGFLINTRKSSKIYNHNKSILEPFKEFIFRNNFLKIILILSFIFFFKFGDVVAGVMANPFYVKIGFSNLSIIQPSFLVGNRKDFRIVEVLRIPVMKFLSLFFFGGFKKYTPIKVEIVVNAMIKLASGNNSEQTYLSDRLQELGSN